MITEVTRKTFTIRESGRSTDFITPSFGHGCLYDCSYCYMKRHKPDGLTIAKNVGDILTEVNNHAYFTPVDKPNQTHPEYTTYDISCNEDFALHAKYHNWESIFEFFRTHPVAIIKNLKQETIGVNTVFQRDSGYPHFVRFKNNFRIGQF